MILAQKKQTAGVSLAPAAHARHDVRGWTGWISRITTQVIHKACGLAVDTLGFAVHRPWTTLLIDLMTSITSRIIWRKILYTACGEKLLFGDLTYWTFLSSMWKHRQLS